MDVIAGQLKKHLEDVSELEEEARAAIARRLEQWLESESRAAQETVRTHGFTVMARTRGETLELFVLKATFQVDDAPEGQLIPRSNIGPSFFDPDAHARKLEIPLSDLMSG